MPELSIWSHADGKSHGTHLTDSGPPARLPKPAEARQRIARLVPGPYLELFARSRTEGWDAWGAEVGKFED